MKCARYDEQCDCPTCELDRAEARAAFGNRKLMLDPEYPGYAHEVCTHGLTGNQECPHCPGSFRPRYASAKVS
jgi:hypothetical protein